MSHKATVQNIGEIVNHNLCIGCGLCAAACPHAVIKLSWREKLVWQPGVNESDCKGCGECRKVCPQSPECIVEYAAAAHEAGERFGLSREDIYYVAHDRNDAKRIRSASGGVTSAILEHLLVSGAVDGVLASLPMEGKSGEPHFRMNIFRSVEDLDQGRSSHYHPLCYDKVLDELKACDGAYALVGVPCILRGVARLPKSLQKKIRFKISLVCGKNATGAFTEYLAGQEGIGRDVPFRISYRDKQGAPDAFNYNNLFQLPSHEIRRSRFDTAFTVSWRNYLFSPECCLYCPDFYGVDADVAVKDAWGRFSKDPLGTSLVIVKNREIERDLRLLHENGRLHLEPSDADEVFNSQVSSPVFKHVKVRDRLVWKKVLRQRLEIDQPRLDWRRRLLSRDSHEFWRLRVLQKLSEFCYFRFGRVPVKSLLYFLSPLKRDGIPLGTACKRARQIVAWPWHALIYPSLKVGARFTGYHRPERRVQKEMLRVLMAGGFGNGNIGDEAQLAANLEAWAQMAPGSRLTVLTPRPEYTREMHGRIRVELAPRVALFGRGPHAYYGSEKIFKRKFFPVALLCLFNACLVRAGLPVFGLSTRQARLLDELNESDVLFLSGGGYLTGMTLSRLWDNMLLIRLADALGVPVILSGQTIGVFRDRTSRALARWGLKKAELIYLRDHVDSPGDLAEIDIPPEKIASTFDDALFFKPAPWEKVRAVLVDSGLDPGQPYMVVNAHFWGQQESDSRVVVAEVSRLLEGLQAEHDLQVVLLPMHATDEKALDEIAGLMQAPFFRPDHGYEPAVAVGLIQYARLCLSMKHHPIIFAMAAGVPTLSLSFDDYYRHKNRGAMMIFGQEQYALLCKPDELYEPAWRAASALLENSGEVSARILAKLEKLRPAAGEVIKKWLRTLDVPC